VHVKRIELRGYKRFTELAVELPEPYRLVMLCGPNGTGKSSLLEGLKLWQDSRGGYGWSGDTEYYDKQGISVTTSAVQRITVEMHEEAPAGEKAIKEAMYFRTAYRNEAEFSLGSLSRGGDVLAGPRPQRMIDNDVRVSDNYQRLVGQSLDALYSGTDDHLSVKELRERFFGRVGSALLRVMPDLNLDGLADPLGGGTFRFTKGASHDFPYKNLSGGEKAAFDLLLDLAVKSNAYEEAVIWIDEPEAHANPLVQGALLDQMLELLGQTSQLWLATHSVAMLRRARDIADEAPGSVAFLDFAEHDFDEPQELLPVTLSRAFWKRTIAASLGDVADLVAPTTLILCEGQPSKGDRAQFDAKCLRAIFGEHIPDADFIAVGNDRQVIADELALGQAVQALTPATKVIRLVDRDDRSDSEVERLRKEEVTVLGRRTIESYLLDEEVLRAYCDAIGQPGKWPDIQQARTEARKSADDGGKPSDDWKATKGDIYNACKRILRLTQVGSTADIFLVEQLSPLLRPGMSVYEELSHNIFG
jgi:predicted ATPase